MNTCILIHFAVGILCALFGYLLGRLFGKKTLNDYDDFHKKIARLETELKSCRDQKSGAQKKSTASSTASNYAFNSALAKTVFGKTVKENDLTIVEGIGPKIQQLFHKNNIKPGNLYQIAVFPNAKAYWMTQGKHTKSITPVHGQNKREWLMKGNGKNSLNGRMNWMVGDKEIIHKAPTFTWV